MPPTTSLRPIARRNFGFAEAQHLLSRAGFGGTPAQIAQLQAMGLDAAVDYLVDYEKIDIRSLQRPTYDADIIRPRTQEEQMLAMRAQRENNEALRDRLRMDFLRRLAEDQRQMQHLREWWLARMIATPRPLEERLVLFWHGHFATNQRNTRDSFLMLKQNVLFREHATGSFTGLAREIVRDPAMIKFLNNDTNRRREPNENLARELMELFTLGEGNYTENDIKEGARALTGYSYADNVFEFQAQNHDNGHKTILGKRGAFNGEDFVDILLEQQACALFVAWKLYRYFVADLGQVVDRNTRVVITNLAQALYRGNYAIKPLLKGLFRSEHFYDPAIRGRMVKSPAQLLVGTVRALSAPVRDIAILSQAMRMMGQELFDPPSVAGWDGGRGWLNTSTLYARQNVAAYVLTGKLPYADGWSRQSVGYEPLTLIEDLSDRSPRAVVNYLLASLVPQTPAASRVEQLVTFMESRQAGITSDSVLSLLLLITGLPEYQLT